MQPIGSLTGYKLICLTVHRRQLRHIALKGVMALERELRRRLGTDRLAALQEGLNADWGAVPKPNDR